MRKYQWHLGVWPQEKETSSISRITLFRVMSQPREGGKAACVGLMDLGAQQCLRAARLAHEPRCLSLVAAGRGEGVLMVVVVVGGGIVMFNFAGKGSYRGYLGSRVFGQSSTIGDLLSILLHPRQCAICIIQRTCFSQFQPRTSYSGMQPAGNTVTGQCGACQDCFPVRSACGSISSTRG